MISLKTDSVDEMTVFRFIPLTGGWAQKVVHGVRWFYSRVEKQYYKQSVHMTGCCLVHLYAAGVILLKAKLNDA